MLKKRSIPFEVTLFTIMRLVTNTAIRMGNPFLMVFARGLDVEMGDVAAALSAASATSSLGPFLAQIADRQGRRTGILLGLFIFSVGSSLVIFWPSYGTFFAAVMLANLGNNVFQPALQAYISDAVSYQKRGLVLSILEISWAGSYILCVPLVGVLISRYTWRSPFSVLAALGLLSIVVVLVTIQKDRPTREEADARQSILQVIRYRPAIFAVLMTACFVCANALVTVMYGVWVEQAFNLEIAAIGAAAAVIGLSELSGEALVGWLADHLGKQRSIILGLVLNSLWVAALPLAGRSVTGAMVWLFVFFLTFEIAMVSTIPLISEIIPNARATMLSLFFSCASLGWALGAFLAPRVYSLSGFLAVAIAAAVFNLLALAFMQGIQLKHLA
ncbi:MAG: MFS transporter [Anaerolineaceae bacterium]